MNTNKKTVRIAGFLKLSKLSVGGGAVFWATTIATSLLPIAAQYRAAFSNWSIQTVWVDSLPVGMIIGGCVSYSLLRDLDKNPTKNPIPESVTLSFVALVIATIMIDVPRSFLLPGPKDALYYFLIGIMFNAARFLLLGIVIGYLYQRLYGSARASDHSLFEGDTK
jgi:tellurite resistance protein TehA-like permease